MRTPSSATAVAALLSTAGLALAQPVAVDVILAENDPLAGSTVTSLGTPVVNGLNEVGFLVALDDGTRGIWLKDALIFKSDSITDFVLTGGESNIGVGNNGQFIYSPSADGDDAVWGQNGLILRENTPAPDFPTPLETTFHSRPIMAANGAAYWVSGINDGLGGTSTQARQIYRQNPNTGDINTVVRAGDNVDGRIVAPFGGIDFDFAVSPNDQSFVFVFDDDNAPLTANGNVAVNGIVVATEAAPTGQGDNWDNFDRVDVNSLGNYIFTGDTDGPTTSDEFIAYNGNIVLRQGDSIHGRTFDGFVDTAALNDLNQLAFIADTDLGESLFFADDPTNPLAGIELLSTGDQIDTTGDGLFDFVVADFNAIDSEDLGFGDDGFIYVEVDLDDKNGADAGEAVIRVLIPTPSSLGVLAIAGAAALRRRR